jgi:hypothetical protein
MRDKGNYKASATAKADPCGMTKKKATAKATAGPSTALFA